MRTLLVLLLLSAAADEDVVKVALLPPGANNPRNSEGDFMILKNDLLMFVYSRFTGGAADDATAELAAIYSGDRGKTWSLRYQPVVSNEGKQNVMSVSLLRLPDGEIAMFYLRKNGPGDCVPLMRISTEEGRNWNESVPCVNEGGYYVLNNHRAVLLKSGRIVLPLARHAKAGAMRSPRATFLCSYSDNGGRTWKASTTELEGPPNSRSGLQEPAVVELKDGSLMMLARTDQGCQYRSYSRDGGVTWSPAEESTIRSPLSPASIARIPDTGDLLLVWNDHENVDEAHRAKRTPFTVAISKDEGKTWVNRKTLDDDPDGWFCYTAIAFVDKRVLLAHCAGDSKVGHLTRTRMTSFDVSWLYK
ncbi:MAG TPA: sialidase family protein [Planctomycetota bacterium]|nr:sialidase family protein [Planctomycetota bacterium]